MSACTRTLNKGTKKTPQLLSKIITGDEREFTGMTQTP